MTLPTDIIFPLRLDFVKTGDMNALEIYLRDLTETLTQMYSDMAQNINGAMRKWDPKVYGMTTEGTATYVIRDGWLRRSGIITELWFDVSWSAHTGTGTLAIELPYQAAVSVGEPWQGVCKSVLSSNAFGAGFTYLTFEAKQNTIVGNIMKCGTGVASAPFALANAGGFAGYIQYIGKENEQ